MDLATISIVLGSALFFLGLVCVLVVVFRGPSATQEELETTESIGELAMILILLGGILFAIGVWAIIFL